LGGAPGHAFRPSLALATVWPYDPQAINIRVASGSLWDGPKMSFCSEQPATAVLCRPLLSAAAATKINDGEDVRPSPQSTAA